MARSKPGRPKPKQVRPKSPPAGYAREPALEAAIIDAPLDPTPRMVYADWLQTAGDRRGDWMALSTALEAEPANTRLRAASVELLDRERELLLGDAAVLLPNMYLGWRGGFIDELRVQRPARAPEKQATAGRFAHLLAHPSCRFVRHITLGDLHQLQHAIDALAEAKPPLLENLGIVDQLGPYYGRVTTIDGLADLAGLRRLSILRAKLARPLPQLRELTMLLSEQHVIDWIVRGGCPDVEELTINGWYADRAVKRVAAIVDALPGLRRLRLLHTRSTDQMIESLPSGRLELLDVSASDVTDLGARILLGGSPELKLVALRTRIGPAMTAELGSKLREAVCSQTGRTETVYDAIDDAADRSWIAYRLETEGRDALRMIVGAGQALYNVGTARLRVGRLAEALPLLDASLTFADGATGSMAWANAAVAHERAMDFEGAALTAREGLLRDPDEPNFYAILIDALRRSGRGEEALALIPRARRAIASPTPQHAGGAGAALLDCLYTLAQAGRHAEVVSLANEHRALLEQHPPRFAVLAMSQHALGNATDARATLALTKGHKDPAIDHAKAVLALRTTRPKLDTALAALARAKAAPYPEWHWIAHDPNLAPLAADPRFAALL